MGSAIQGMWSREASRLTCQICRSPLSKATPGTHCQPTQGRVGSLQQVPESQALACKFFWCLPCTDLDVLTKSFSSVHHRQLMEQEGRERYLCKSFHNSVHDVLHSLTFACTSPLKGQHSWCCFWLCLLQLIDRLKEIHLHITRS